LRQPIAWLFEADGVTLQLVYLFCGPLALAFFFNGTLFVSNAAFNNLGHPFYSTWVNWGRHTLGTVPFVLAGGALLGAPGVLIGQAEGGIVFALIAAVLAARVLGQCDQRSAPEPRDGISATYRRQVGLMSLFHNRR